MFVVCCLFVLPLFSSFWNFNFSWIIDGGIGGECDIGRRILKGVIWRLKFIEARIFIVWPSDCRGKDCVFFSESGVGEKEKLSGVIRHRKGVWIYPFVFRRVADRSQFLRQIVAGSSGNLACYDWIGDILTTSQN